jgi:hypothetical protein
VVGRLKNNNYRDASGAEVFGYSFTCEEIDYLDSKAEAEARRQQQKQAKPAAGATVRLAISRPLFFTTTLVT